MYTLFTILIIIASILLILAVLVQNSKGGGLAANFSGANQIVGVRQATDFIEKFTWILAIAIVVLSMAATVAADHQSKSGASGLEQKIVTQPLPGQPQFPTTGANKPAAPAQQQPAQSQPAQEQPASK